MALLSRQQVTLLGSAFWNSDNLTGSQTSKEDSYTDETGITNDAKSLYENAFTDSNPGIFFIRNTEYENAISDSSNNNEYTSNNNADIHNKEQTQSINNDEYANYLLDEYNERLIQPHFGFLVAAPAAAGAFGTAEVLQLIGITFGSALVSSAASTCTDQMLDSILSQIIQS